MTMLCSLTPLTMLLQDSTILYEKFWTQVFNALLSSICSKDRRVGTRVARARYRSFTDLKNQRTSVRALRALSCQITNSHSCNNTKMVLKTKIFNFYLKHLTNASSAFKFSNALFQTLVEHWMKKHQKAKQFHLSFRSSSSTQAVTTLQNMNQSPSQHLRMMRKRKWLRLEWFPYKTSTPQETLCLR